MLIAKTPRAGEFNHRYLVADSSGFEANDVLDWARRTTSRICGPDFFAVYHDVAQLRGGRTGEEGLMLVGIDTASLGEYQRVLLEQLQALLPDLETLVTQEIDWQDYSHEGMVIACPKLNEWMKDLEQSFKQRVGTGSGFPAYVPPQINVDQKPNAQVDNHGSSNKSNRVLFLIAVIAVISLGLFVGFFMKDDEQASVTKNQEQLVQAQEKLTADQAEFNRSKEKLAEDQNKLARDQKKLAKDQAELNRSKEKLDNDRVELNQAQEKLDQNQAKLSQAQAINKNKSSDATQIIQKYCSKESDKELKARTDFLDLKKEICDLIE
jgi:hypothetical protein